MVPDEDDMPLAQRLLQLQKQRAQQLAATTSDGWKPAPPKAPAANTAAPAVKAPTVKAYTVKAPASKASDAKRASTASSDNAKGLDERSSPAVKVKPDPHTGGGTRAAPRPVDSTTLKGPARPAKKARKEEDASGEEGEDYRWWEQQKGDGTEKWKTLSHNGLYFAPPYEPHGVKMRYDGVPVALEPEAEEVATFFSAILGTDHHANETFCKNFFADFCETLRRIGSKSAATIRKLELCDFSPIAEHLNRLKEARKALTKEEKEQAKAEKAALDKEYGTCLLDGRREKIGNYRVEPPGLFRGRGKHPKAGMLKRRVQPEDVTINISEGAPIPRAPPGHAWGKIIHDPTVTWLATWEENINNNSKYVFLAPGSSLKGQSDMKKFEVARQLKKHIKHIRAANAAELRSKEMLVRQRATALWLIDRLALRAGNEKGDDEADTVGCCSLRKEHVTLEEPSSVIFDFLGKDSIRYYNKVEVDAIIFKNLGIFMRAPKTATDPIFDRLNTSTLNKYLTSLMPGLTAKVFRTYNASHTFQEELKATPAEGTIPDLVLAYNRANRQVAVLCNHQRAVPKTHEKSMEKLTDKLLMAKYQRKLLRDQIMHLPPKDIAAIRKECPEALAVDAELTPSVVKRIEAQIREAEEATADSQGAKGPPGSPVKKALTAEVLTKRMATLCSRIKANELQLTDRDENKATSLSTSKMNYIDPRITVAWCAAHSVPLEKMFNKTLREKFTWALSVPKSWSF